MSFPTFLKKPAIQLALLLLIVFLAYLPRYFGEMVSEDYLIYQATHGSQELSARGLSVSNPDNDLWVKLENGFHYFNPSRGTTDELIANGLLPWWTPKDVQMHMFRPLATLTHWLDFSVLQLSHQQAQFHTLLWFMFLALALFFLYKKTLDKEPQIVLFAAFLMYFMDVSQMYNFHWLAARNAIMAPAFGCWAVLFHIHFREKLNPGFLIVSLLFLALALLSAEAGIATFAYLAAYAITLDRRGWIRGIGAITPAIIVIVLWRVWYTSADYGVKNLGLYFDPLYSTWDFIQSFVSNYSILVLAQISGVDASLASVNPHERYLFQLVAFLIIAVCSIFMLLKIRKNKTALFYFLGSAAAIVPFCVLVFNNPRSLFMASIGFFPVVSIWFYELWQRSGRKFGVIFRRTFVSAVLLVYILIPFAVGINLSFNMPFYRVNDEGTPLDAFMTGGDLPASERPLIYITYPMQLNMFLLYSWDANKEALPPMMYQLALGLNSFKLERLDSHQFLLTSDSVFCVNQNVALETRGDKPKYADKLYGFQSAQSMFVNNQRRYTVGEKIDLGNMNVTVLGVSAEQLPVKFLVEFAAQLDPDHFDWRYYDWGESKFVSISAPAVGESRYFPNSWDYLLDHQSRGQTP